MTWKLYLDDLRPPPDQTWVVARSVHAAWHHICTYGLPLEMSLDHDLGTDIDAPVLLHSLIEAYLDHEEDARGAGVKPSDARFAGVRNIKFKVHSANPTGAQNMEQLWANFLRCTT
jgi:hypothetical protein